VGVRSRHGQGHVKIERDCRSDQPWLVPPMHRQVRNLNEIERLGPGDHSGGSIKVGPHS
jgi:hypothetical protein